MMKEHPSPHLLKEYSERLLPPDLFLVVHDHIVSCATCSERCSPGLKLRADYENIWSAVLPTQSEPPPHLSGAEMKAYLNEHLGEIDLEIAESHLEVCEACKDEAQRLRGFEANAATEPRVGDASGEPTASWRRVPLIASWPPQWRSMRVVAILLLAGLIVAALVLALMRNETPNQTNQLTSAPDVNSVKSEVSPSSTPQPLSAESQRKDEPINEDVAASRPPAIAGKQPSNSLSQIILALRDGGRQITIDDHGNVRGLDGLPDYLRQAVENALREQKLVRSKRLNGLDGRASTLLSESSDADTFRLLSPVGTVVESEQPTFRWLPLTGAQSYAVTIVDAALNEVVTGEPLLATEWQTPQALERGALYSWQVTAVKDGKRIVSPSLPAPQAKFKILDGAQAEELKRMRQQSRGSHLAMGVFYAQEGILDKAEQEFTSLLNSNPRSVTARKLLDSVRSMRAR
ncbi:MAG: hypothetical protein WCF57_24625 [Pyrinomonadaceae bacterium]